MVFKKTKKSVCVDDDFISEKKLFAKLKKEKNISEKQTLDTISAHRPNRNLAIASFVLAFFCWIPMFNILTSILSVTFGIMALYKIKKDPKNYKGTFFALFGIIIGVVVFLLSINYFIR